MGNWLHKMERKLSRYAPRNLMTVIVIGTALLWLLETIVAQSTGVWISYWLYFDKAAIFRGEVWRIVTFIFLPQDSRLWALAISLYFYWIIGNSLENQWGSFRFDLFYFVGILGTIVGGLITGFATNAYINMSLFLAFALLYPNHKILLFFFVPIKVKWLGIFEAVFIVLEFVIGSWPMRIALLISLVNLLLFFGNMPIQAIRRAHRRRKWQREAKRDEDDYPFDL